MKKKKKIKVCEHGHVHYDSLERLCNLQTEYIKQCTKSIEIVDSHNVRLYQSNKILHERLIKMEEQMKAAEANMNLLVREVCTCYQHLTACKNPMHDRFLDEKVRLNVEQMKPKH